MWSDRKGYNFVQLIAAGALALGMMASMQSAVKAADAGSPSLQVRNPHLLLDGPDGRDNLMVRIHPDLITPQMRARWNTGFQRKVEQLDDEGSPYWQNLVEYKILLSKYLVKRRCRTASSVQLRADWRAMLAHHDMLLATVGEDAVSAAVAEAAADADARPCG